MNALILAAGLGTRLRPLTDSLPKALVPVAGRPMLEHQILKLKAAGFDHIVVNVHHFGEKIIDFIGENREFGIRIDISDEREKLLDTGGAVRQACRFFAGSREPILVHNVDVFSDAPLAEFYSACQADDDVRDAALVVSKRETSRYLAFDERGRLVGWKKVRTGEVKTPFPELRPALEALNYSPQPLRSDEKGIDLWAFSGIHVISSSLAPRLEAFGEAFSIIDFYLAAAGDGADIRAYAPSGLRLVDAGKTDTLPLAAELLRCRR